MSGKILPLSRLQSIAQRLREGGKRLVLTNGCFDLLHVGHVRCLKEAKSLGDLLIVGVNSDDSVRRLKGEGRPLMPQEERAEILAALEAVDYVVIFEEDTAEKLVSALQPDLYVKGGTYTLQNLPEASAVTRYGGEVRILSLTPGFSTSELADRILARFGKKG
ncbi:MAG: D-glycero-beta-D-manno-heptose 1-phosphate adenylyltransferase [Anaerolineae bacterium]